MPAHNLGFTALHWITAGFLTCLAKCRRFGTFRRRALGRRHAKSNSIIPSASSCVTSLAIRGFSLRPLGCSSRVRRFGGTLTNLNVLKCQNRGHQPPDEGHCFDRFDLGPTRSHLVGVNRPLRPEAHVRIDGSSPIVRRASCDGAFPSPHGETTNPSFAIGLVADRSLREAPRRR